jgi:hypothetical protein
MDGSGYFDLFCALPKLVIRSLPCSTDDAAEAGHLGSTISLSVGNWIAFLGHEIPYDRPLCADIVAKVFLGWRTKFLEPLMRFTRGDVRDHIVSSKSKDQLSRDF